MRLRFTDQATEDLAAIADYILPRSPVGARHVRDDILASARTLTHWPDIGRRQKVEGVRKLVTRRYQYLIYYAFDKAADEVLILAIRHPARDREYSDA